MPVQTIITRQELAGMIDHTLLKPEATQADIEKLCAEAKQWEFASVCINPANVSIARDFLKGAVDVCTVVGFPLGANATVVKAYEAERAIEMGATEIDMVINIGKLRDGDRDYILHDIEEVLGALHHNAILKVIVETGALTHQQKIAAAEIVRGSGAEFIKTSTGMLSSKNGNHTGATVEDIRLFHSILAGSGVQIKASGGIATLSDAVAMIEAGAHRIGTSRGVDILSDPALPQTKAIRLLSQPPEHHHK